MKANLNRPILTLLATAISCALPLVASATDQADTDKHFSSNFTPIVNKVRDAVLGFSRKEIEAYNKAKTPCVTGPEFGAMGVHFINTDNMDGILDVNKPEALIYEPQSNGRMRLVGVEYIVPKPAWDALHPGSAGPAGAAGPPVELRRRAEPLRPARVLRDPRLGVRGQS